MTGHARWQVVEGRRLKRLSDTVERQEKQDDQRGRYRTIAQLRFSQTFETAEEANAYIRSVMELAAELDPCPTSVNVDLKDHHNQNDPDW